MKKKCELEDRIVAQLKKYKSIRQVYLFGSYAKGTVHSNSDIDIAILFSKKHNKMFFLKVKALLEKELRKDVDVISLNNSVPLLAFNVLKFGKPILIRSEIERIQFQTYSLKMYFDYMFLHNQYMKILYNRYDR